VNPDRLAELEEEQRFLLRSIADLQREHAAGDIDDADFRSLRDGYVSRAAAVINDISVGRDSLAGRPRRSKKKLGAGLAVAAGLAVGSGVVLARAVGDRAPGQVITGGQFDDVAISLSRARQLLATDPSAAIEEYKKVLDVEPDNVEALTYSGWLVVLQGNATGADDTVGIGIEVLASAREIDPTYPDAVCFMGVANAEMLTTPKLDVAMPLLEECLAKNPPAEVRQLVESVLATAQAAS
jgi:hypothetical protein